MPNYWQNRRHKERKACFKYHAPKIAIYGLGSGILGYQIFSEVGTALYSKIMLESERYYKQKKKKYEREYLDYLDSLEED